VTRRLTDEFSDLAKALDGDAFRSWVAADTALSGPSSERTRTDRTKMMVASLQHRTTLDITDLMHPLVTSSYFHQSLSDVTECVPPWDLSFVEWEPPAGTEYGDAILSNLGARRMGTLTIPLTVMQMAAMVQTPRPMSIDELSRVEMSHDEAIDHYVENLDFAREWPRPVLERMHWHLMMFCFARGTGGVEGPIFEIHMMLDRDGNPLEMTGDVTEDGEQRMVTWNEWSYPLHRARQLGRDRDERRLVAADGLIASLQWIMPTLQAFHFCNHRNIIPVEKQGQYASRQARRDAERRKLPPLTKYHVLEILPAGSSDRAKARPMGEVMREVPLHGVRRHTRVYTHERPMFGKHGDPRYVGRFWVKPHTRGTEEAGVIQKKYAETQRTFERSDANPHGISPGV
jgi:hypothetical protein